MPTAGKLWDNLKAAGIDKSSITKVVFTHGHPDHLWGAVDELDDPMLPNAKIYVAAEEWDFWHGDNAGTATTRRAACRPNAPASSPARAATTPRSRTA
jgi:glyoxylase-like metal-dependent hydrolase (beta-lactamase superfamily II)